MMNKIHVLPDENLGGGPNGQILREYVEVDRHPKKGDYVYVSMMDGKEVSEIAKVIDDDFDNDFSYETIQLDRYINGEDLMIGSSPEDKFVTIEPTDIVHIDNQRYRLVDRKAKVGEKVIVIENFAFGKIGEIHTIKEVREHHRDYTTDKAPIMNFGRCLVLEAVEPAELVTAEEGDDKSVLDLLANLARRVTELERKLKENRREFERYADITRDKYDLINTRLSEIEKNIKTSEDIARDTILKALKEAMKW
jgi:hypothetical protein